MSALARRLFGAVAAAAVVTSAACSVGQGTGGVRGNLKVENCNDQDLSSYDMQPDFFGGMAMGDQLLIRIQRGGYLQEYADSLSIAVQDTKQVVDDKDIEVQLQRPPGSGPEVPYPLVRMTLSLRATCGSGKVGPKDNPQVVLHATKGTVRFHRIVRGDPYSSDTNAKRIEGNFRVFVTDPRASAGPNPNGGWIEGEFKFFYQRGGPAQPFP